MLIISRKLDWKWHFQGEKAEKGEEEKWLENQNWPQFHVNRNDDHSLLPMGMMVRTMVMRTMMNKNISVFSLLKSCLRYGEYYFDDGTQAPIEIEVTDQNQDYDSSI